MTTPMPPEFAVSVEPVDGHHVVRVTGELDLATVEELQRATDDLVVHGRTVDFDLDGLAFIDSTGLRYFVGLHQAAQRDGFSFRLRRPRPEVLHAFELTGIGDVMPWTDGPLS